VNFRAKSRCPLIASPYRFPYRLSGSRFYETLSGASADCPGVSYACHVVQDERWIPWYDGRFERGSAGKSAEVSTMAVPAGSSSNGASRDMPGYLERYRRGEWEDVWADLVDLGGHIREPPLVAEAQAVARETMTRA
jgi:hypothetical protein